MSTKQSNRYWKEMEAQWYASEEDMALNGMCPRCYGHGTIEEQILGGYYRTIKCPSCDGTGASDAKTNISNP